MMNNGRNIRGKTKQRGSIPGPTDMQSMFCIQKRLTLHNYSMHDQFDTIIDLKEEEGEEEIKRKWSRRTTSIFRCHQTNRACACSSWQNPNPSKTLATCLPFTKIRQKKENTQREGETRTISTQQRERGRQEVRLNLLEAKNLDLNHLQWDTDSKERDRLDGWQFSTDWVRREKERKLD